MSEGTTTMVSMNELEKQIELARLALSEAMTAEEKQDWDALLSMERTYCEGFLEALEFIYTLQNGHEYNDQDND